MAQITDEENFENSSQWEKLIYLFIIIIIILHFTSYSNEQTSFSASLLAFPLHLTW